jgi:hypothetical protein
MNKKDALTGNASAKSLVEAFRCGDCLHHKHHAHSTRQKVCIDEGVPAVSIAPSCFTPDITRLSGNSDAFAQVATIFQTYDASQRRILLGLLRAKKKKHAIGTKLYFRVGDDYISNYLAGFVAGYTSVGELMLIGSPDQKTRGSSFTTYMTSDEGLLTFTEWRAKSKALRDESKIHDPANRIIKKPSVVDGYEPPTIDAVPREWYDKTDDGQKKPKKKAYSELTFPAV